MTDTRDAVDAVANADSPTPSRDRAVVDLPTTREIKASREAALASLDQTIGSLSRALAATNDGALSEFLKDALIIRAELRTLQIDRGTIGTTMRGVAERLRRLNRGLEDRPGDPTRPTRGR
jgi:hypothetical protein